MRLQRQQSLKRMPLQRKKKRRSKLLPGDKGPFVSDVIEEDRRGSQSNLRPSYSLDGSAFASKALHRYTIG